MTGGALTEAPPPHDPTAWHDLMTSDAIRTLFRYNAGDLDLLYCIDVGGTS